MTEEEEGSWELEKCRLQQELQELRGAKRVAEEAAASAQQACQARAAELRSAHQQHQEDLHRLRRDCEREVRRLVGALNHLVFQLLYMHIKAVLGLEPQAPAFSAGGVHMGGHKTASRRLHRRHFR